MSTSKQVSSVLIGAFIYNGAYRGFSGYPITLPIWNVSYRDKADFLTNPVTRSLNGFERGNPMGWRSEVTVSLDNSTPANSSSIRALLSLMSSQYTRTFFTTTIGTVSGNTIVITNGVQIDNFYQGLVVINDTVSFEQAKILSYVGSTRVATLDRFPTWASGNNMRVVARSNYPTILGISPDATQVTVNGKIIFCNLLDGTFGIERQLTVGNQVIQMNLTEVERKQNINDELRIL